MSIAPDPTVGIVTAADLNTDGSVFPILKGRDFTQGKTPSWTTGVRESANGRLIRASWMSSPIWEFSIRHNVLRDTAALPEVQSILAFFNNRQGRYGFFFYLDPDDYTATDQAIGTGTGSQTVFQFKRAVGPGTPYAYVEPVFALWENPVVKVAGVTKALGSDYTVSPWGVLTFAVAPTLGQAVTWTGKFLFVCSFLDDKLTVTQLVNLLWSQDGLEFRSLKP